jgi:hypothetical protein
MLWYTTTVYVYCTIRANMCIAHIPFVEPTNLLILYGKWIELKLYHLYENYKTLEHSKERTKAKPHTEVKHA